MTDAKDFLTAWAQARFGPDGYTKPAARFLDVNETTFHRWVTGKVEVTWDHPVVQRAVADAKGFETAIGMCRDQNTV